MDHSIIENFYKFYREGFLYLFRQYLINSTFVNFSTDFSSHEHGGRWTSLCNLIQKNFGKFERRWNSNWYLLNNCWFVGNSVWNAF